MLYGVVVVIKLKNIFVKLLYFYTILTVGFVSAKVQLHSDNQFDVMSLQKLQPSSLSVETNLAILGLPSKELSIALVPLKRSLKFMDDGLPVCVLNRIKTAQRSKKYLFSHPVNIFINRRLYQLNDLSALSDEVVDLEVLFQEYPDRKLVISSQLSYGDELDTIIRRLPKDNLIVRNSGSQARGTIEMFIKKRAEYALFTPQEFVGEGYKMNTISYEIKNIEPYIVGHLMCSNTPETKHYIKQVNAKIEKLVKQERMYKIHLRHLSEGQGSYFDKYYKQTYQALFEDAL